MVYDGSSLTNEIGDMKFSLANASLSKNEDLKYGELQENVSP